MSTVSTISTLEYLTLDLKPRRYIPDIMLALLVSECYPARIVLDSICQPPIESVIKLIRLIRLNL